MGRRAGGGGDAGRAGGAVVGRGSQRSPDQRRDPRVRAQARHAPWSTQGRAAVARRDGPPRLGGGLRRGAARLLRRARAWQGYLARSLRRRAPFGILRGGQRGVLRRAARDETPLSRRVPAAEAFLPAGSRGAAGLVFAPADLEHAAADLDAIDAQ